jgi:hypothetical protein
MQARRGEDKSDKGQRGQTYVTPPRAKRQDNFSLLFSFCSASMWGR